MLSCSPKQAATAASGTSDQEAEGVAKNTAGLIRRSGAAGYFTSDRGKVSGPFADLEVSVENRPLDDEEKFWGYQWKGQMLIHTIGGNKSGPFANADAGFDLLKRGDKWFIRVEEGSDRDRFTENIDVSLLRPVRPACPTVQ